MYCKCTTVTSELLVLGVLIVAKCIVNSFAEIMMYTFTSVLIVAKCIVNRALYRQMVSAFLVLIVAKCIVNLSELAIVKMPTMY